MTTPDVVMIRPTPAKMLIGSLLLAAFAAAAILLGSWANLDRGSLVLTAGCGAILGLIPTGSPAARIGAFVMGIVIAWVGYGVRAALLPDNPVAEALVAFAAIALVGVVGAATRGRVPVIAALLGLVAMTGGYDADFVTAPYNFISDSIASVGAVLAGAAVGMLAVMLADWLTELGKNNSTGEPPVLLDPPPPVEPLVAADSASPIFDVKG